MKEEKKAESVLLLIIQILKNPKILKFLPITGIYLFIFYNDNPGKLSARDLHFASSYFLCLNSSISGSNFQSAEAILQNWIKRRGLIEALKVPVSLVVFHPESP